MGKLTWPPYRVGVIGKRHDGKCDWYQPFSSLRFIFQYFQHLFSSTASWYVSPPIICHCLAFCYVCAWRKWMRVSFNHFFVRLLRFLMCSSVWLTLQRKEHGKDGFLGSSDLWKSLLRVVWEHFRVVTDTTCAHVTLGSLCMKQFLTEWGSMFVPLHTISSHILGNRVWQHLTMMVCFGGVGQE